MLPADHRGQSMETDAQRRQRIFAELAETLELLAANDPLFDEADAARRSESNILQWMKYLPEDCINRMIEMGWDVTT
jgi:hypothetical protein